MADPAGPIGPQRDKAAELLRAEGIDPPSAKPRRLGKGKRLSYRYPTAGIPGAPPRNARRSGSEPDRRPTKRYLYDEERHTFAVLSLRVWLASLPADARRVRSQYAAWQAGTQWTTPSVFDKGLGGFSALKDQADEENARVREAGGDPLADALARAASIRPDRAPRHSRRPHQQQSARSRPRPRPRARAVRRRAARGAHRALRRSARAEAVEAGGHGITGNSLVPSRGTRLWVPG